jgi:hypothetical protein
MPAIAPHRTATTERDWDGPATVASAPAQGTVLRYMHAWYAGDNPDTKASYRFPHHASRDGSPAVLPAVRNGLARLAQASIPASDREGVARHLRSHLEGASE